jgi:minor extracellular serine protease Vpr
LRRILPISVLLVLVFSLFGGSTVLAVDPVRATRPVPAGIDDLRLDQPVTGITGVARPSKLEASLRSATGVRQVVVRLAAPAVAEIAADGASAAAQRGAKAAVTAQQDRFVATTDGRVLGRTQIATNAVVLQVNATELASLAADPNVVSIRPVIDYALALSDSVPYIGAASLHSDGITGDGITVAVLDSGIDYTHAAFGGTGTLGAYTGQYGDDTADPENKDMPSWGSISSSTNIIGGFDFVGETWPDGGLRPDPDPIDCGDKFIAPEPAEGPTLCSGGHGTHVADIIGGIDGVAPGVELYAVKVCSAVSTSCSGVALLLGMDFALDPNADGDTADHVDLVNMSLGSLYGQAFDDDLSLAVENATDVGVLTVAAAGNGSDKPYVHDTPSGSPSAFAVAQTAMPNDVLPLLEVTAPAAIAGNYPAVFQPWSEPLEVDGAILDADLQYADGAGGNLDGCLPFDTGTLTGLVVLVNRGACDFSLKISNIAAGGAAAGIIGMINADAPFTGALGECPDDLCSSIPGFMVSLATANALRSGLAAGVVVNIDPASGLPLVGTVVGSSSRGPTMLTNIVKPEIAAPGASISAEAGTGDETTPFGGTSGATPMITGSAALLLSELDRSPAEIKSLLMNYAETEIYNGAPDDPINAPLAGITRIGGGEVRVDQAWEASDIAAWDTEAGSAALSFGFVDASDAETVLTREVTVANYGGSEVTLNPEATFRFEDDEDNGAVSLGLPGEVVVPAGGTATFDVEMTIDGSALRTWWADSGFLGNNPAPFNELEYDGYINLSGDGVDPLHLAWMVLPRQSGEASLSSDTVTIDGEFDGVPAGSVMLDNDGVGAAGVDGYSLVGTSPVLPTGEEGAGLPTVDLRYAGTQTIPVPADFCSADESFLLLLAVNTWERQTLANAPAAFEWDLDTDGDGAYDYAIFNQDLAGDLSDGRNAVFSVDLATDAVDVFFFTDHGTNSGNTVLTICAEQIGMNAADFGTPITADLLAVDTYFTGRVTDVITGIEFAPLGERYFPIVGDDGFGSGDVPAGGSATLNVQDYGPVGTNATETGVLLFTDAALDDGRAGAPQDVESLVLSVAGAPPPPVVVPFTDISDSKFVNDIVWAWENGITVGCTPTLFCPNGLVTRGQMATFLTRALDLPATSTDFFTDDEGNRHEANINRIAAAGITVGCGPTTYCPNGLVTRAQMATFLTRAFDLPPTATDFFTDDEGNRHEANINRVAEAGITHGCGPTTFCPNGIVTRGQMAAFLHRAVGD